MKSTTALKPTFKIASDYLEVHEFINLRTISSDVLIQLVERQILLREQALDKKLLK